MSKAVRYSASIAAPKIISAEKITSTKSEDHPLVSIALFCGIGLLISLVAVLFGVQGAWY